MFQTAAGVTIPFPEKLSEQYQLDGDTITLNLSFEKLDDFVHSFYAELNAPLFLAVHPDAESEEVWYLDGMTKKQLAMILDGYGELLYQDGLSAFAIGSLQTEEEIFVQKYKVISIYSTNIQRFVPLLEQFGVSHTDKLLTAWDTFSEEHPGEAQRLQIAGQTIPDMITDLQKIGMYKG
ncbi:MAG: hypothetical protein ACOYIE_07790 [Agathobaculum sp.]|jgi:hypothetical protein|uniref:hypothetical protein n=1 Tax=Agathobaculum sp. TaxID=2048138 RepID=UPI003D8E6D67